MVIYNIKAHPTIYSGVNFRSRLEATWAAFFDLVEIKWQYEPYDFTNWVPDFLLTLLCPYNDCSFSDSPHTHTLLAEVKPFESIAEFFGHPCTKFYGLDLKPGTIPAQSSACLGNNPNVSYFELWWGGGAGPADIANYVRRMGFDIQSSWNRAGALTQWSGALGL